MKKILICAFLIMCILATTCFAASSEYTSIENTFESLNSYDSQFISELVMLGIFSESDINMQGYISSDTFFEILSKAFNRPFSDSIKSDKVSMQYAVSAICSKHANDLIAYNTSELMQYKDFGFIKRDTRPYYIMLIKNDIISDDNGFLYPNKSVKISDVFNILSFYKYAIFNLHSYNAVNAHVNYTITEGELVKISASSGDSQYLLKVDTKHKIFLSESNEFIEYKRNFSNGDNIYFLTDESNNIIYVRKIVKKEDPIVKNTRNIYRGNIFYIDDVSGSVIFKNTTNLESGKYEEGYKNIPLHISPLIYSNYTLSTISDINLNYLDCTAYFITEMFGGAEKVVYINTME